jgi:hypothetical protein
MDVTLTVTENLEEPVWSPKRWECTCDFPTFSASSSNRDRAIDEARGIALNAVGQFDHVPSEVRFLGARPSRDSDKELLTLTALLFAVRDYLSAKDEEARGLLDPYRHYEPSGALVPTRLEEAERKLREMVKL